MSNFEKAPKPGTSLSSEGSGNDAQLDSAGELKQAKARELAARLHKAAHDVRVARGEGSALGLSNNFFYVIYGQVIQEAADFAVHNNAPDFPYILATMIPEPSLGVAFKFINEVNQAIGKRL